MSSDDANLVLSSVETPYESLARSPMGVINPFHKAVPLCRTPFKNVALDNPAILRPQPDFCTFFDGNATAWLPLPNAVARFVSIDDFQTDESRRCLDVTGLHANDILEGRDRAEPLILLPMVNLGLKHKGRRATMVTTRNPFLLYAHRVYESRDTVSGIPTDAGQTMSRVNQLLESRDSGQVWLRWTDEISIAVRDTELR